MKKLFFLFIPCFAMSCMQNKPMSSKAMKQNTDSLKTVLMKTDAAFSDLSKAKGRNAAFISYVADQAVLLRPNNMPIIGKDSIAKRFSTRPDTGFTLTWKPLYADISASGELGYTYGTFLVISHNDTDEGTYATVWKKDTTGQWKFILDTGNEGLKPADADKH